MTEDKNSMSPFEFKKMAMSDPYSQDPAFLKCKSENEECQEYLKSILSFDKKLANALTVDHVSPEFKAKLKLRQVMEKQEQSHRVFRRLSYAASITLATVAGFFAVQSYSANQQFNALYNEVASHIMKEPGSLTTVQSTAQMRMQSHLAAYAGLSVPELSGLRYSQLCPIGDHKTWHASMDTDAGVVTVIFIKEGDMSEREAAKKGKYVRLIKKSSGNVMLVGDSKLAVDSAYQKMTRSFGQVFA